MQPSNIQGLRSALRALGYEDVLTGLDLTSPKAKNYCRQQIQWVFDESDQTAQDDSRRKKALSLIERFAWPRSDEVSDLQAVPSTAALVDAVDELYALLEEEQVLRPMEIEEVEEDEDGEIKTITVSEALASYEEAMKAVAKLRASRRRA